MNFAAKALSGRVAVCIVYTAWMFVSVSSSRQLNLAVSCPISPPGRTLDFADAAAQCGPDAKCSTCSCALMDIFGTALTAGVSGSDQDIPTLIEACLTVYTNDIIRAGADRASLSAVTSCVKSGDECSTTGASLLTGSADTSAGVIQEPSGSLGVQQDNTADIGVLPGEIGRWVSSEAPNCTDTIRVYVDPFSVRQTEENGLEFTLLACPNDGTTRISNRVTLNALGLLNAMAASSDLVDSLEPSQVELLRTLQSNITSRSFNAGRRKGLDSYVVKNLRIGRRMSASRIMEDFRNIALPADTSAENLNSDSNTSSTLPLRPSLSQRVQRSYAAPTMHRSGTFTGLVVTLVMVFSLICMW